MIGNMSGIGWEIQMLLGAQSTLPTKSVECAASSEILLETLKSMGVDYTARVTPTGRISPAPRWFADGWDSSSEVPTVAVVHRIDFAELEQYVLSRVVSGDFPGMRDGSIEKVFGKRIYSPIPEDLERTLGEFVGLDLHPEVRRGKGDRKRDRAMKGWGHPRNNFK